MIKILRRVAESAVIAVAIGGPVSYVLFGLGGPKCDLDDPRLTDAQHELCWNQTKKADKEFSDRAGALMVGLFSGLMIWGQIKQGSTAKNTEEKMLGAQEKTLPCAVCGTLVKIPAKYARAKTANCGAPSMPCEQAIKNPQLRANVPGVFASVQG